MDIMLLDYARPAAAPLKRKLAMLLGMIVLLCAGLAVWCAVHTTLVIKEHRSAGASVCVPFVANDVLPLGLAIPLGVLSGVGAFAAAAQAIRFANGVFPRPFPSETQSHHRILQLIE